MYRRQPSECKYRAMDRVAEIVIEQRKKKKKNRRAWRLRTNKVPAQMKAIEFVIVLRFGSLDSGAPREAMIWRILGWVLDQIVVAGTAPHPVIAQNPSGSSPFAFVRAAAV